ncbi:hypothetical protein BDV96DRAFT_592712 [Lophiotrema nucula]|uniref:Peptidase domain-containing protein n=1 Tax=Lophiotrema nucula TaxID=690887 RepID=A0A6A5YG83_9PLEO|nr:hypothetical protein BDV96DRAFT_592712 [Lophiotrema nucula]
MCFFPISFAILAFAFALAAHARIPTPFESIDKKTYYIDRSCDDRREFRDSWNRAIDHAAIVVKRVDDDHDHEFHDIFNKIFQVDMSKRAYVEIVDEIMEKFEEIANWKEATGSSNIGNLRKAHVKVYCDNDAFYDPGRRLGTRSDRWYKDKDGWYKDDINMLKTSPEPMCAIGRSVPGSTYTLRYQDRYGEWRKHKTNRVTITFCDYLFNPTEQNPPGYVFGHYPLGVFRSWTTKRLDKEGWEIDDFSLLIAHNMLHEMVRATTLGNVRDVQDEAGAYKWKGVLGNVY